MNPAPPRMSQPLNRRLAVAFGLLAAGGAVVLYFFNPTAYHFYPVCQFHRLTGLNCPGCGATRALYALLHGDITTALRDNGLLVAALAAAGMRGVWLAVNRLRGRPNGEFCPARYLILLLVVAIAFGVLRNLPACSFLSPTP